MVKSKKEAIINNNNNHNNNNNYFQNALNPPWHITGLASSGITLV